MICGQNEKKLIRSIVGMSEEVKKENKAEAKKERLINWRQEIPTLKSLVQSNIKSELELNILKEKMKKRLNPELFKTAIEHKLELEERIRSNKREIIHIKENRTKMYLTFAIAAGSAMVASGNIIEAVAGMNQRFWSEKKLIVETMIACEKLKELGTKNGTLNIYYAPCPWQKRDKK